VAPGLGRDPSWDRAETEPGGWIVPVERVKPCATKQVLTTGRSSSSPLGEPDPIASGKFISFHFAVAACIKALSSHGIAWAVGAGSSVGLATSRR
jgi:hypothetical protein